MISPEPPFSHSYWPWVLSALWLLATGRLAPRKRRLLVSVCMAVWCVCYVRAGGLMASGFFLLLLTVMLVLMAVMVGMIKMFSRSTKWPPGREIVAMLFAALVIFPGTIGGQRLGELAALSVHSGFDKAITSQISVVTLNPELRLSDGARPSKALFDLATFAGFVIGGLAGITSFGLLGQKYLGWDPRDASATNGVSLEID